MIDKMAAASISLQSGEKETYSFWLHWASIIHLAQTTDMTVYFNGFFFHILETLFF